ncbi:RPS10 [Cordylochernes scorpioides]|uniref:RPS10 n=1 Tax=Cordylochernes scorpioides TaxID=51811 RepID=A0ABY6JXA6_9ARAC|nr:RPS10 [Cordylochernes scorpioides]
MKRALRSRAVKRTTISKWIKRAEAELDEETPSEDVIRTSYTLIERKIADLREEDELIWRLMLEDKENDYKELEEEKDTFEKGLAAWNGSLPIAQLGFEDLTPPNRRQRLEWCRARSTWMTEWHRVVFSDESRFCLSSDSRRVRVWRRRGERSNPAAIVERPTVRQRGIMGVPNALYQQDNARPHTARISQQALQDVQMLPWPPYSPDLSPIEHVWDIIGRRLHALPQPRSEDELWQMVEREWRAIPQDAIRTLIDSLPRRAAACIAVRELTTTISRIRTGYFKGMKINPDMTRSYRNCNNCHNTQLTPEHIYPGILAALYMTDINPEEDIHTDKAPQLAWYCDQGVRTDLICSMDKILPSPLKAYRTFPRAKTNPDRLQFFLKSKCYVDETYAWQIDYYRLNNTGIQALRNELHLPTEVVPYKSNLILKLGAREVDVMTTVLLLGIVEEWDVILIERRLPTRAVGTVIPEVQTSRENMHGSFSWIEHH